MGIFSAKWSSSIALCMICILMMAMDYHYRDKDLLSVRRFKDRNKNEDFTSRRVLYEWTPKPKTRIVGSSAVKQLPESSHSTTQVDVNINSKVIKGIKECEFKFKLYIYELPSNLIANAESARANSTYHVCRKCIFEQFALEYVIYDYFHGFCGRTYNPDEADFFYLPIIRDIDYRIALGAGGPNSRASSQIEVALLNAIEKDDLTEWKRVFQVTDKYWNRFKGSDHIIVMPAPVTNLRHQSSMRGFFHYMIQLNRPIFINVEFSRSFTEEYPVCARKKNIVAPYPSVDPLLYSGQLPSLLAEYGVGQQRLAHMERDRLFFYQGGHHGSCVQVRVVLGNIMRDNNQRLTLIRGDRKRELGFRSSIFCAIPIGDSPSSKRMYDVLNYGCIPVILSDDLVYAFSIETGGNLSTSDFSIRLPQRVVQRTAAELLSEFSSSTTSLDGLFGYLPASNTSVYRILEEVARDEILDMSKSGITNVIAINSTVAMQRFNFTLLEYQSLNTLIRFLLKIPQEDIKLLQNNVKSFSSFYRFYEYNSTMSDGLIPLTGHVFPSGGSSRMIASALDNMKKSGIQKIATDCLEEKSRKHRYIGDYPCYKNKKSRC